MKKILTLIFAAILSAGLAGQASADLIISGVVDGTQSGGNPKVIELVATSDIADLSAFTILRDTNGSTDGTFTISSDFQLPVVSLNAGDFFYVFGNADSETFLEAEGFGDTELGTAVLNGIANHNGDDILAISTDDTAANIVDAFGLLGQGDTNFAANSIAYRQPGTPANASGVLDAGNFDITAYTDELATSTLGTFVVPAIPEPSSIALLGLVGLAGVVRRRK